MALPRPLASALFLFILLFLIGPNIVSAGTFDVRVGEDFVRRTGEPVTKTRSFAVQQSTATYMIRVWNGGRTGQYDRVSSAIITLNGVDVFRPSDFNQQVALLERSVPLVINNTFTVELRSAPGSGVTIEFVGIDTGTPNLAPVVNAGPDQTITLPNTATLNGTVTDDGLPTPPTLTITWSKVSGPGTVTFSTPNAASTTATFSQAGMYALRLTASDSQSTSTDDVAVTVNPANQAPVVNAGPDLTITLPNTATLNGTVTDDGLPTPPTLTITWSKVNGPGTVTFSTPNAASTTATFSQAGMYALRLTASDTQLTSTDDVTERKSTRHNSR